jgi:hypothetical protein
MKYQQNEGIMISSSGLRSGLLTGLLLISGSVFAICDDGKENAAVRSSTPTEEFMDHGNGTVTHIPTGLMWKRCAEGHVWTGSGCTGLATVFSWQGALDQAYGHSFAGHSDWRLPNVNELQSIVEQRCWDPAINTVIFPRTPYLLWSASPFAEFQTRAWIVLFDIGRTSNNPKSYDGSVRLVRTAQ